MERFDITEGTDVYGSDGDKVGSVVAVQPNYVVVEKGFFFPTDYYIPTSAITSYDDGKIYLNVTKDQALSEGWDVEPTDDLAAADYSTTDVSGTGYAEDRAGTDASYLNQTTVTDRVTTGDAYTGAAGRSYDEGRATADVVQDDTLRVPVRHEELAATKSEDEIGRVRIDKTVVAEEQALDVPVTEERVRVQRRVVDRDAGTEETFDEGTIEVPVRGETVHVQKQVRVGEEIEVSKEAVERTERVADTVRREEVRINEDVEGNLDTGRNA
jgi:uncharacterized protein (TIGR02271 family)